MTNYLIIFFIIFLVIFFLLMIKYLFKEKKVITQEHFRNKFMNSENIYFENFSNSSSTSTNKILDNNLINNGYFENGKNSSNNINQSGYNKIINMKNPGLSSYVLEQKKSNELTYYELLCDNVKNSKYILYFWLSVSDSIDELDFEKLIKIKMENEDFSNYIPRVNYNIIQKVNMTNDPNTWYLIKYDFISGPNTGAKTHIYLNYGDNLQYDFYYFTNISLYRVLIDAENFTYNHKLLSYVDGYHYESNSPTWHDLSGNGYDLFWSNIPIMDSTKGSLNSQNLKITGFPSNKLSNENFSILICLNKNIENTASDDNINEEDNTSDFYLLSMPGNERYSFEIKIKDNYIYLISDKNIYKSTHEVIFYNKSLFTITYNNGLINIYNDGLNILSKEIKKLYFSNDNILFNRNKNLNINLYSILFYDRVLETKELDEIREYFVSNKNKNFNTPDINNYQMNSLLSPSTNNNSTYQPYNKKITINNFESNYFKNIHDNQNKKIKNAFKQCNQECLDKCLPKASENLNSFLECTSECKNNLDSCKQLCVEDPNNANYCKNIEKVQSIECPKVYKKDGNYKVYIKPNSYYANKLNYSGERNYGNKIEKARYTYNINFPKCPTPVELIATENTKYAETCPFIINEANPCNTSICANVNWNVKNYKDIKLNKNCKKLVSNYCHINYELDDKCICWDPKYKDDQRCINFRGFFEDPLDYCSPGHFKIEDHPEFSKYIKKDNIPCWGCKI